MNRLDEIKSEMLELLDEAMQIVKRDLDSIGYERAKSYWYAHIKMALTKDHDYLGSDMFTLEDAANKLGDVDDEEDD